MADTKNENNDEHKFLAIFLIRVESGFQRKLTILKILDACGMAADLNRSGWARGGKR